MDSLFKDETTLKNLIGEKIKVKDSNGNLITLTMIDIKSFTTFIEKNKIIQALFVDIPNSTKTTTGRKKLFEFINSKEKSFIPINLLNSYNVFAINFKLKYYPNFDLSSEGFLKFNVDFTCKFKSFNKLLQSETEVKYYIDFLKLIMKQDPLLIDKFKIPIKQWFLGTLFLGKEVTNQDYTQFDLDYEEFKKSFLDSRKTTDIEIE